MWKFLKVLFRNLKRKVKNITKISFEYEKGTTVNATRDKDGSWTVDIDTHSDLGKKDILKIIKEIKRRTD